MRRASDFLYVRLYKTLKEQILTGLIEPGEYLLPENELCKYYGLSRNSVRKALEELHKEGLVLKRVGLGTMVPADLAIQHGDRKIIRIAAPFPAYFVDNGLYVLCDAFRQKYPHVDIHVLSLPADTFAESLLQSDRMGFCPDIVLIGESQLGIVENQSLFEDLGSVAGAALEEMYPKLRQSLCPDKTVPAVPITFSPTCLAYNPDLFADAGIPLPGPHWNVDDFTSAAERVTSITDGRIDRFGFSLFPSLSRWLVFALQNGMRPMSGDNRPIIAQTLDSLQDWLHRKRIATVYTDSKNLINPFIYGKSGMTLTTLFEMSTWTERGIGFKPEIAPLPFGDTKSTLLQANLLLVPRACADPGLSLEFVNMALQADVQRTMCESTPFLSVLQPVNTSVKSAAYLHAINVGDRLMDNNYFLHELLDQQIDPAELMAEMSLFWLGLEDGGAIAEHF
jgi:multiple sugar transport system substrate-binding protein